MNELQKIASMIDISAVRADSSMDEVRQIVSTAKRFNCIAVFSLTCFIPLLSELLDDIGTTLIGGVVGFPSGGETTAMKVFQTRECTKLGCAEIDMVQNIGLAVSDRFEEVENDIRAVKQACGDIPLKVILECHYLTDQQIRLSAEAAVSAGADWVKTGTGWAPTGATPEIITLLKETVGGHAKVKAAGGVRDLDTLLELHRLGAERFGVGLRTVGSIFEEATKRTAEGKSLFSTEYNRNQK